MTPVCAHLLSEIGRLSQTVGFAPAAAGHPLRNGLPAQAGAFVSQYAWLLVWPVADASGPVLLAADQAAADHLVQALPPEAGRTGSVIDGYVVLALPSAPDGDLPEIRQVRLKRSLCRRAVVWPAVSGDGWEGVGAVTVLDIPGLGEDSGLRRLPELSADEAALLARIDRDGKAVAQADIEDIGP